MYISRKVASSWAAARFQNTNQFTRAIAGEPIWFSDHRAAAVVQDKLRDFIRNLDELEYIFESGSGKLFAHLICVRPKFYQIGLYRTYEEGHPLFDPDHPHQQTQIGFLCASIGELFDTSMDLEMRHFREAEAQIQEQH